MPARARVRLTALILLCASLCSIALYAGTAYIVFWLNYSGWWWLLTLLFFQGECAATYKILNAVLFDRPLKLGDCG
jgi:hypothetical protein